MFEMGWRKEAIEVLKKGIEKFPDDEELKQFLKDAQVKLRNLHFCWYSGTENAEFCHTGIAMGKKIEKFGNLRSNGLVFLKYVGVVMESNFITKQEIMENNLAMAGKMGK